MKCHYCFNEFENESNVCPFCGSNAQADCAAAPQPAVPGYDVYVQPPSYAPQYEAPAKKKFPVKIIIALTVVVALIVCSVIFVPKIAESLQKSKNPALKDEDVVKTGQMFSAAIEEVSDEETKSAINVFSSVYNTLFASKSFSLELEVLRDFDLDFDVVFGKDLASSQLILKSDYINAGFYEGRFYYTEDDFGIKLEVADIVSESDDLLIGFGDVLIAETESEIEYYKQRLYNCTADDVPYYEAKIELYETYLDIIKEAQDDANNLGQTVLSVIEDEHLNLSAVDDLLAATLFRWEDKLTGETGAGTVYMGYSPAFINLIFSLEKTENVLSLLTDFLVRTDGKGLLNATSETKDKSTVYEISFDEYDMMVACLEWVLASDELLSALGGDAEEAKSELERELEYYKKVAAERDDYIYTIEAAITDNYITSMKLEADGEKYFELKIEDVNSAVIEEEDFHDIRDAYNACDEKLSFDEADDILDIF